MIIDTTTNEVFMVGPGNYDLMAALPPGTTQFTCTIAPSGHLMLPCAEFGRVPPRAAQLGRTLALPVDAPRPEAQPFASKAVKASRHH